MTLTAEGMYAEPIARLCWENNRSLQIRDGEDLPDLPWDAAPWYRKKILIMLVLAILRGTVKDAGEAHEFWRSEMLEKGWQWGERKDYERQVHPFLRPWNELTGRQQLAQKLNFLIVKEIAASEPAVILQE